MIIFSALFSSTLERHKLDAEGGGAHRRELADRANSAFPVGVEGRFAEGTAQHLFVQTRMNGGQVSRAKFERFRASGEPRGVEIYLDFVGGFFFARS